MTRDDAISRRRLIRFTGAATAAAVLAGCTDGGGPGDNETGDNETADNETEDNETAGNETGDNETAGNETEDNETAGNETEGGAGGAIEPGEIQLEAVTENWIGMSPDSIADEENPTMTLTEGETYEVTWENGDGAGHNFAIWDENQEVVDDYESEIMNEEGETQTVEVEVTSEMAQYVCIPHQTTMVGDIEVQ